MIKGIQITQAANDNLLNSFWLLDSEKGKAASMAQEHFRNHVEHLSTLRNHFIDRITNEVEDVFVNGSMEARHPGNASITFEYIEGESILLLLNQLGVYVSTGSACSSASLTPSHVLTALGVPWEMIHGTVRFSFGDMTNYGRC